MSKLRFDLGRETFTALRLHHNPATDAVVDWDGQHLALAGRSPMLEAKAMMMLRAEENRVHLVVRRAPERPRKQTGFGQAFGAVMARLGRWLRRVRVTEARRPELVPQASVRTGTVRHRR